MAVASLANRIQVNTNCANNDALYGPYNSIAEAISSIPSALLNGEGAVGRTIGITENGLVIEYWWQLIKAGDTPSQNQYGFTKKGLSLEDIPEFPDVDGKIEEAINNIEFPDYTKTFKELSEASKNNADNLNLLKDNIFNPDGSVNNNFISTMMLRVGADSMNYHMLKTKTIFNSDGTKELTNGTLTNYSFSVLEEDTLAHFIYTDGNLNGEWKISGGYITSLNPGETYFICLKCNRNNEVGVWECSTTQHKVDEDENYWYFNWGILVYDKDGNYNLIETRGNAYMYGDNLMCGKISTMAGNSYFDLTHGNFVLGDGTGPALEYINGVLTIRGSKGDAEETLAKLGIIEKGVSQAQSTADAANTAITAEQAARQAAIAEIQKQVAAEEEARTEAIAGLESVQSSLQTLIDGEVTSWFMEGEPTTTNKPASDWTGTDENGVAFDYRQRHEGDTYTDISEITLLTSDMWEQGSIANLSSSYKGYGYDSQKTGNNGRFRSKSLIDNKPEQTIYVPDGYNVCAMYYDANELYLGTYSDNNVNFKLRQYTDSGLLISKIAFLVYNKTNTTNLSYTLADELKLSINPTAGQSWRWCNIDDEYGTGWHWHKIADSDAVKALQEAAKAQSTADGKSTTFIAEPKNYDIGDLWILAADRTLNGTTYKQGTILTANAASATFVASHWSEKVKYIDESIAAQQAQQALDELELGGRNLLLNSKPYNNTNWKSNSTSNITFTEEGTIKCQTNGGWARVYTPQFRNFELKLDDEYTLSMLVRANANGTRKIYLGTDNASIININFNEIPVTTEWSRVVKTAKVINTDTTGETTWFQIYSSPWNTTNNNDFIEFKEIKLEQGNKSTAWTPAPEDVDSKADAIKVIADGAAASAQQSNDQLANMSNDNILTPQEKGSVADEWACIQEEYSQNSTNKTTAWGSATVAEWTTYDNAYTTLQTYVGTLALTDRTTNTTIVKSTFQENFVNYYSANVAFLNALSKKVAELEVAAMEIGVRNLWAKKYMMDWNDTYAGIATKGSDEYGEYIAVHETNLYEYIGKNTSYNDILQGKVQFEEGKQYCLKVKWRTPINNAQWGGLYFIFEYTDGTVSESIICSKDYLTPTISTLITTKGKTVSKVRTTYGSANKTRIYEIQLVQATKQPNDWLVAPEDVDAAVLEAKESAELANAQLDAIDNDKVIAISERAALETQLEQIQSEYNEITNDMNRYNIDPTNYEKAADKAIEALQYHCGKVYDGTNTAPINADKSITIVAGTSVGYGYGNISAYYTARQTALETIANAVKTSAEQYADNAVQNVEVGVINLLNNSKVRNLGDWSKDGATVTFDESTNSIKGVPNGNYPRIKNASVKDIGFVAGKYYTLSMDVKANAAATRSAYIGDNSSSVIALSFGSFAVTTSWNRVTLTALCQEHDPNVYTFALYIYCGTTKANDKTEYLQIRHIKIEEGQTATAWSPSVADTEAEIRAAESKAEALGYLTEVLEDSENTTDITGGLVMTNVLMLKDLANAGGNVGAGMSGISADNILLWGGGAYEDAVHAKDNNFEKLNGSAITTLLKKDGTGKIGIFKISDTQAVVDVPNQGKVIIDASTTNGGIRVLNSSGKINAALLPSSIESFKPKADESSSTTGSKVYSGISTPSSNNVTNKLGQNLSLNGGAAISFPGNSTTSESKENHTQTTTVTVSCSSVSVSTVYVSGSITRILGVGDTGEMRITITAELYIGGTLIKSGSITNLLSNTTNIKWSLNGTTIPLITSHSLPTMGSNKTAYIRITARGTSTSSSSAGAISSVALKVWGGATTVNYKTTTAISYSYPPQTIIGTDGLISLVSNSKYFMVDNSGSTQKIYAKGLSQEQGTPGSGELYVTSDFIDAFKAFVTKAKELFAKAKYVGTGDAEVRDNANTACDNILSELDTTSIIANS